MTRIIQTAFNSVSKLDSRPKRLVYIFGTTLLGVCLGFLISNKIILPLLCSLPVYLFMLAMLRQGKRREAVLYMLLWALLLGIFVTLVSFAFPVTAEEIIIIGAEYRDEMFSWIRTGIGTEGTPSRFIPQHMLHLGLFVLLSILTMSSLSIFFGAVLMNYMAFYVSQLMLHSPNKILIFLVGWHFWSLFRIAAFVILGAVLAEFLAHKYFKYEWSFAKIKSYVLVSAGLIMLDITAKVLFAPAMGEYVRKIIFA